MEILTYVADVDREILLRITNDKLLGRTHCLSKYTQLLCDNYFWGRRFTQKFNVNLDQYGQINYKQIYLHLTGLGANKILIWACKKGYLNLVEEMIKRGAKISPENDKALVGAARNGHADVVKCLIENKGICNRATGEIVTNLKHSSLCAAAEEGHLQIVMYLIEHTNYIHNAIILAAKNGHLEIVKYLLQDHGTQDEKNDALVLSVENGHLNVVKYLAEKGAKVNSKYPLISAVKKVI